MNHHKLKIAHEHYFNVACGTKTFEIRNNDRAFQKGDTVEMHYWDTTIYDDRSRNGLATHLKYFSEAYNPDLMPLHFKIGDVYPIDAERVVFSLIKGQ